MTFRRGVSAGVAPAAGVELASSEALSAEDGRTVGSSPEEAGEARSLVSGVPWGLALSWARKCAGTLRTTVKEFLPRRLLGVPAGMVGVL